MSFHFILKTATVQALLIVLLVLNTGDIIWNVEIHF